VETENRIRTMDDLPVLAERLSQMRIVELLDQELPKPHGNRQGWSYGQLCRPVADIYYDASRSSVMCSRSMGTLTPHARAGNSWEIGDKDCSDECFGVASVLGSEEHQALMTIETELGQHPMSL